MNLYYVNQCTKLSVHHDKFPSPNTVLRRQQISCLVTWLARLAGGRSGSYEADNSYSNTLKGKIAATTDKSTRQERNFRVGSETSHRGR